MEEEMGRLTKKEASGKWQVDGIMEQREIEKRS